MQLRYSDSCVADVTRRRRCWPLLTWRGGARTTIFWTIKAVADEALELLSAVTSQAPAGNAKRRHIRARRVEDSEIRNPPPCFSSA